MRNFCLVFVAVLSFALFGCSLNRDGASYPFSDNSSMDSSRLSGYLLRTDSDTTRMQGLILAQMVRDHAMATKSFEDFISACHVLFNIHYDQGHNSMAYNVIERALAYEDSVDNPLLNARSHHYLGRYLVRARNYTLASKNFSSALHTYEKFCDTSNISAVYRDLVRSYNISYNYDSAFISLNRCFYLDSHPYNPHAMAENYAHWGNMFLSSFKSDLVNIKLPFLDSAKVYFDRAVAINSTLEPSNINVDEITSAGYAEYYYFKAFFGTSDPKVRHSLSDSALVYFDKADPFITIADDYDRKIKFNVVKLRILISQNRIARARHFADSICHIAEMDSSDYVASVISHRIRSLIQEYDGDAKGALKSIRTSERYLQSYEALSSSVVLATTIARSQDEGNQMKAKAIQLSLEGESRGRKMMLIFVSVILGLFGVIAVILFVHYRRQRRLNNEINDINKKLEIANKDVNERNREITDSITYARLIQTAAMPSETQIKDIFGDSFIFLRPRDIVSGDFYWAMETGPYKLVALGDCTGHGVPGALLSMLGMSILDYTTRHFGDGEISAGNVLDRMRIYFKRTLNQNSFRLDKTLDSIDIGLIVVDTQKRELHYAGAFRPLLYFRNDEMIRIKADPMPIGVYPKEREHFTNHTLSLCKDDIFYLFSDGVTDQSGYHDTSGNARVYSFKRFQSLLVEIHKLHFAQQKRLIRDDLRIWRSPKSNQQLTCEQTDDVSVLGIAAQNFISNWD